MKTPAAQNGLVDAGDNHENHADLYSNGINGTSTTSGHTKTPYQNGHTTTPATHSSAEAELLPKWTEKDKDWQVEVKIGNGKEPATEGPEGRQKWGRKVEYILTTIGFCVGMGNVLRFPYICIRNGGGAFLLPYILCLTFCGIPLFFLEVGLGQFMARGALHVWNICPLMKGIGITMNVLSLLSAWYFSLIISLTLIYTVHAFRSPQPWTVCGQDWNSQSCIPSGGFLGSNSSGLTSGLDQQLGVEGNISMSSLANESWSISSSREFWLNNVLELSPGFESMNGVPWHTAIALLVAVVAMFACIIQGVKSVGKVVYVTATIPYLLLTLLIIQGASLPGAIDGVIFYLKPDFGKLLSVQTWVEACIQVFSSLGPAYGGLITMASYNKFNNNCLRDAVVLSFVCEGTSVFAGFAIFTVLGHMAHTLNVTVDSFTSTGPGLAFVVYPEAISYLPVPQLWGVLFFVMLFTVALDSQFTLVETVLTSFEDYWPKFMTRWNLVIKIVFGVGFFLACLPFASRGGMYLFHLIDWYFSAFTVLVIAILECVVVSWIYGADRFLDDLSMILSRRPPYLFSVAWKFITPLLLLALLGATLGTYQPPTYEGYTYGNNARGFGWFIASVTFLPVPGYAIYTLCRGRGTFMERLKASVQPSPEWGPGEASLREQYTARCKQRTTRCDFRLPCASS